MTADNVRRRFAHGPVRLGPACLGLMLAVGGTAFAQQASPANVLGGFSKDNGPINIQSDTLTINDQKKIAIYKGNVVAVQGDNTLRTVELEVQYTSKDDEQKAVAAKGGEKPAKPQKSPSAAVGDDSQQIKRIKAKQKVVMVSTPAGKEAQSATSDHAEYDVVGQIVEMRGNVFIKQGENVICGSKVTMNLKTSEYSVEKDPTGPAPANPECGRVRSVFFPQKKADGAAKSAAPTPAATAAQAAPAATPSPAQPKQPTTSSWTTTTPR